MSENSKVFISHASEDKERFVLKFAERLLNVGIDVWLDKWEMLPGDSLVDKIFDDGIKDARAFIVVLSTNSICKPWVKEELNAAIIKRLSNRTKIIPIVLDNVEIPECLKSTLYESISDINNYDKEFNRIKNSILGIYTKPILGTLPKYSNSIISNYASLTNIDSIILDSACKIAICTENDDRISFYELINEVKKFDISEDEALESVDFLSRNGYFEATPNISGNIPHFTVRTYGMDLYIRKHYTNIIDIEKHTLIGILQNKGNKEIATENGLPLLVVNNVFENLYQKGLIKYSKMLSGDIILLDISPEIKRILQNL